MNLKNISAPAFGFAATIVVLVACRPSSTFAQTRTWTNANPGNFLTNSNWSGGVAPNGVGQKAVIGANPTADGNFTLNGAQTLGTLDYSNTGGRQLSGTGTLTFQVSSGNALFHTTGNGFLDLNVAGITLASTTEFFIEGQYPDVYSPISGSGGLMKSGGGILWLRNNNNSYTGLNIISDGVLYGETIANNGANSSFGRGNFSFNGGGLEYLGASTSTNRTIALGENGGKISVTDANAVLTWAGVISGGGYLEKRGAGTLQLNAGNTYAGNTSVNEGTLRLGANQRIVDTSFLWSGADATFDLNNFNETIGGIYADGAVALGSGTLTLSGGDTFSQLNGVVSGTGGLTVNNGSLNLGGTTNSYSGLNTINSGTMVGSTIANNGTNSSFGRGNFSLSNDAVLQYTGASAATNRTIALGTNGGSISVDEASTVLTWAGVISGSGYLDKSGAGTLQLNASNTYVGDTYLSEGILRLGASQRIVDASYMHSDAGTTFELNNFNETIGWIDIHGAVALGGGTLTLSSSNSSVLNGVVSGTGGLTVNNGSLRLGGTTNSYSGLNTVNAGTMAGSSIANNGTNSSFGRGNFALSNGGAASYTGTSAATNRNVALGSGGGAIEVTNVNSTLSISGAISGAGGLTKSGPGKLALSGTNTYAGSNTISAGTLSGNTIANSGVNSAFGQGNFAISNGATLEYSGATANTNRTVSLGTGGGSIGVSNSATTLEISGAISGAGGLTKSGPGKLALSGTNTYAGSNTISAGTLSGNTIANGGVNSAFGQGSFAISNGATWEYSGGSASTNRTVILGTGNGSISVSNPATTLAIGGIISGIGNLIKVGTGALQLNSANSYAGSTLVSAGTLILGASQAVPLDNEMTILAGGSFNLNHFNQSLKTLSGSGAVLLGGGNLTVGHGNASSNFAGSVTGPGNLIKTGGGVFALTGSSNYAGQTYVQGGTLNVESGGRITDISGYLGYNSGTASTATVTGSGSKWQNSQYLYVGESGAGTLNIRSGGVVSSDLSSYLGNNAGSTGTATVSGLGAQWQNTWDLFVGSEGTGVLAVEDGGLATDRYGWVGRYTGSSGTATITGSGSRWQNDVELTIALSGTGTLNVEHGGLVTSTDAYLGRYADSTGTATVTGAGSQWQNSHNLYVGNAGAGTVTVENGGVVEVGGTVLVGALGTLTGNGGTIVGNVDNHGLITQGDSVGGVLTIDGDLTSTGIVAFELAGLGGGHFDQLLVSGLVDLGGLIEIDLLDGFDPIAGNSFKLLDFGSFTDAGYTFDFTHAVLGGELTWDTSTFSLDGTISVVPEPSSLVLAGMASIASFIAWRKRRKVRL